MSGLLLCGRMAEKPLRVEEADISLYSVEELCYYLYNNIYMIGPEFFNSTLLSFIENELQLENVAKSLRDMMFRNESYVHMIKAVFEGSCYYSEKEKESIMAVLEELENKSAGERMKARADLLAGKGRYVSALRTYGLLLEKNYNITDGRQLGCIWNNMGVVYAKLFFYQEALKCFRQAYDICGERDFMDNLICAALLAEDGGEAEKELRQQYQIEDDTMERYRMAIELAKSEIEQSPKVRELRERLEFKRDMELSSLYSRSDEIMKTWKRSYREQIQ